MRGRAATRTSSTRSSPRSLFLTVGLLSAVVAGWVGLLFGALLTLPLAFRRRWPVAVFASTVASRCSSSR